MRFSGWREFRKKNVHRLEKKRVTFDDDDNDNDDDDDDDDDDNDDDDDDEEEEEEEEDIVLYFPIKFSHHRISTRQEMLQGINNTTIMKAAEVSQTKNWDAKWKYARKSSFNTIRRCY